MLCSMKIVIPQAVIWEIEAAAPVDDSPDDATLDAWFDRVQDICDRYNIDMDPFDLWTVYFEMQHEQVLH